MERHDTRVVDALGGVPGDPLPGNYSTATRAAASSTRKATNRATGARATPSTLAVNVDVSPPTASDSQAASTGAEASPSASATADEVATRQRQALARTHTVGHFSVKFTEADVGDGNPQTYVLARVTSHSSDTTSWEQRGIIVSLIGPSGALDVRTTLCVELFGNT
ncbi:hypothetical protein [Streptomyces sp. NBC_00728]|uniref:hypothetical protein n=1 Tax=Streptomyces sp. NBC_00728 TaxID=2903676 RepID=UPI00386F32C5